MRFLEKGKKGCLGILLVLALCRVASAQNYEILDQQLDQNRLGYTVMRVWGSHYQMGYGLGSALAQDIEAAVIEAKDYLGDYQYGLLQWAIGQTVWPSQRVLDELQGIHDGVKSLLPGAETTLTDLKILNTFGDWGYYIACRSHSCWGSLPESGVRTLSTRRLDFSTPFSMDEHHVLVAWDPDDGSPRWVNLAWIGYAAVVTGVNEYGTLVSLHDYGSTFEPGAHVPRCVATRQVLTEMGDIPIEQHLGWAQSELSQMTISTGTFLNYYAPDGHGGVFTCTSAGSCDPVRVPQSDFFSGEVLMTTNSQTSGHSVPWGGEFMGDYYDQGGPKHLEDHFTLMGTGGLHLMSVEFRGREDMTIWFRGKGLSGRVEAEWSDLFPEPAPDGGPADGGEVDGGVLDAGRDAGQDAGVDAGPEVDAGQDAGADTGPELDAGQDAGPGVDAGIDTAADEEGPAPGDDSGCACRVGGATSGVSGLLLISLMVIIGCRRRR